MPSTLSMERLSIPPIGNDSDTDNTSDDASQRTTSTLVTEPDDTPYEPKDTTKRVRYSRQFYIEQGQTPPQPITPPSTPTDERFETAVTTRARAHELEQQQLEKSSTNDEEGEGNTDSEKPHDNLLIDEMNELIEAPDEDLQDLMDAEHDWNNSNPAPLLDNARTGIKRRMPGGPPDILRTESKNTIIGNAIITGYEDNTYTQQITNYPFTTDEEGFILLQHEPHHTPRVYILNCQLYVDNNNANLRKLLIDTTHQTLGHAGSAKVYTALRQQLFWPGMYKETKERCTTCDICQRNKQPTTKPPGHTHMLPIPTRPWDSITIDFLGPFNSNNGYKHIMVVIDRFSSAIRLTPLKDSFTAMDVANAFTTNHYAHYGLPTSIVSDRDPRFTSAFWKGLHAILNVKLIMATVFHQQTNGQVERANKTIGQMLRTFTENCQPANWLSQLWRIEHAFNFVPSSTTGRSPFEIQFGHSPRSYPMTWDESNVPMVNEYLNQLRIDHDTLHDALTESRT